MFVRISGVELGTVVQLSTVDEVRRDTRAWDARPLHGEAVFISADDQRDLLLAEDGLKEIVRTLDMTAPGDVSRALLAAIDGRRGDRPADDDATLLTLVHNGRGPHAPSLGEKLEVYAKVFGIKSY